MQGGEYRVFVKSGRARVIHASELTRKENRHLLSQGWRLIWRNAPSVDAGYKYARWEYGSVRETGIWPMANCHEGGEAEQ